MDQYHLAVSGERDGLWDWDLASNRVHFSPRWLSIVGCEDGEAGSSPEEWFGRVHPQDLARVRREVETHLESGDSGFETRHRVRHRDGTYRWVICRGMTVRDVGGTAIRLVGSLADVTAEHCADPATGLPNREMFLDRLGRAIERARRRPEFLYAVLLIDLEPSSGGDAVTQTDGDPLLTTSARRIETCLHGTDDSRFPGTDYLVARLRGLQFAVLLEGLAQIRDAQAEAERVLAALVAPLAVRGRQVFPRASIGIAVSATGYAVSEDALRDADTALYRARSLGGNRCDLFDVHLLQSADRRSELEADLERALERGEFLLHYQPVVDAALGRIAGLEALARWQHPTRGLIPPGDFIPLAEASGFIVPLETWTLQEACRQLKAWQASLPISSDVWVSVNVSGAHFKLAGIVERVGDALRSADLDPACLVVELTESVVVEDPGAVKTAIMQLRVMGVRVGIDDFGTGHSSFAYLHEFPADFLKVDQSFTRGMEVRREKADIVDSVAGLATQLGLHVIAEGIESLAGLESVRSRRCGYLQGFLFSPPVGADAAAELLRSGVAVPTGSSPNPPLADANPGSRTDNSSTRARSPLRGRRRFAYAAVAALAVVVSLGLPGRLAKEPAGPTPPAKPSALAIQPPLGPMPLPANPIATATAVVLPNDVPPAYRRDAAAAIQPPTASAGARDAAPGNGRATATFAVEHQHVLGGCRGVLRVSSSGLSFASDDRRDVFEFEHGRFESALRNGTLTIKDGRRTYRFKPGDRGDTGGQAQLQAAMSTIAGLQQN